MGDDKKRTRQPNGRSSIYLGSDGKWHGRVTVGVRDDGRPDRRHVKRKTKAETAQAVRELEKQRESRTVKKPGKAWTVQGWLTHWIENIAPLAVGENTMVGYGVAVRIHLIPGLGAHRLDRLRPEHIERLYAKMQANGSASATAHQVHRTFRTALNEAVRRGHLGQNPVRLAKAPRLDEKEIEPYTVNEVRRLLRAADKRRNSARWAVALALGLRQGEALGLKWTDIDLDDGVLWVRRSRRRPKYAYGCGDTCGRKAGYCPQRRRTNPETADTKSRAGRRAVSVCLHSLWTFSRLTGRRRSPNERRRGRAGAMRVGSSPQGPDAVCPRASTTTSGRSCYRPRRSGTAGCTTPATPRQLCC
jgi:integrase